MIDRNLSYPSQPVITKKKNNITIIIFLVIVFVVVSIFIYSRSKKTKPIRVKVIPTLHEEPTPTEKAKIDKELIKIQVLNGTGTPGQAGEVVKILEEKGYKMENITTGNADKFSQEITSITARSGFGEVASEIKEALEEKFNEVDIESTELEGESEYDIVIITGGKKYEEPTSSPSPTSITPTEEVVPTDTPTPSVTPTPTS